ncbi:MAG: disulfide bond formation protein DsbD [Cytophagales bacterium]|nr:MAG: disulfide bond formation protein DsbD [Cytophagales bacterium]
MKKYFVLFILNFLYFPFLSAQIETPVKWNYSTSAKEVKQGETIDLIFNAEIIDGWHMFSSDFSPDLGPIVATFTFEKNKTFDLVGKIKPLNPKKKFDDIFGGDYTYFNHKAVFKQKVKILLPNPKIVGEFKGQACTDDDGKCVPLNEDFEFNKIKVIASSENTSTDSSELSNKNSIVSIADTTQSTSLSDDSLITGSSKEVQEAENKTPQIANPDNKKTDTLWDLILLAFGGGLIALITPCVFPMIPMTVTFFLKSSKNRKEAINKALIFGISIIVIYAIVGIIFSATMGADAANIIATHWLPNIIFFLVFLIFGISFLGAFEIMIPSSLVNKIDAKADQGGLAGIFFMAFAIVLVTFSCTGPIVGSVLVLASDGQILKPIIGMVTYASAFAIPFTLFAMFPSWLNKLPKSGGWLNVVKVSLGFIELALGLKFLSIADQVYGWHILDREIYIAIWIVIFTLLGIYLLGKIKMPHDSPSEKTSVARLLLAILSFTFSMYLFPGMFGAPLKALSGYLPPLSTHDFDLPGLIREYSSGMKSTSKEIMLCETPKYSEKLHLPHGLNGYFDYKQAIECAKKTNKPLFIDFTGHGCVNCREMEANVWSAPEVLNMLRNDFLIVALYVDEPTKLAESDIYISKYDGKKKKNIGSQNADRQITQFNNNAQPYYVLLDPFTEELLETPTGYDKDVVKFIKYLESAKARFKQTQNKRVNN